MIVNGLAVKYRILRGRASSYTLCLLSFIIKFYHIIYNLYSPPNIIRSLKT
jgi:hypothetical protein